MKFSIAYSALSSAQIRAKLFRESVALRSPECIRAHLSAQIRCIASHTRLPHRPAQLVPEQQAATSTPVLLVPVLLCEYVKGAAAVSTRCRSAAKHSTKIAYISAPRLCKWQVATRHSRVWPCSSFGSTSRVGLKLASRCECLSSLESTPINQWGEGLSPECTPTRWTSQRSQIWNNTCMITTTRGTARLGRKREEKETEKGNMKRSIYEDK